MVPQWVPDDDSGGVVPCRRTIAETSDLTDGFEVLREVTAVVRAAILTAVPDPDRALVAHLVAEGTPRAWAQAHGLSVPEAVAACRRVEAELPTAFQRAYAQLGPVAAADHRLLRAWIDVHMLRPSR